MDIMEKFMNHELRDYSFRRLIFGLSTKFKSSTRVYEETVRVATVCCKLGPVSAVHRFTRWPEFRGWLEQIRTCPSHASRETWLKFVNVLKTRAEIDVPIEDILGTAKLTHVVIDGVEYVPIYHATIFRSPEVRSPEVRSPDVRSPDVRSPDIRSTVEEHFVCPITRVRFEDPVVAEDGATYERAAIETWLHSTGKSPLTGLPISSRLVPNRIVKSFLESL